jgi:hypothetical protein
MYLILLALLLPVLLTANPTGPGPYHLASGDLNRDGFPDLVIVCRGELLSPKEKRPANDTITVYFTAGSREPVRRQDFRVGFGPYTAVVRDLDGDGYLDVAVVNFQANDGRDLSVLWGQREAPFLAAAEPIQIQGSHAYDKQRNASGDPVYPTPGLTSVAVLDRDRARRPDLAVVAWSSDFFAILRNEGNRRFTQRLYPLPPGPRDVVSADLNRDGIPDLAFTIYSSNLVEVWLGDDGGAFRRSQQLHSQGHIPYHLKAGDLDGDGYPELVVGNRGPSDNVVLFRNEKGRFRFDGSFGTDTRLPGESTADEIRDVLLHDVDGDGRLDLLAAGHVSHKVVLWRGTGRLGFGQAFGPPQSRAFPGKGPRALLAVGDRIAVALFDSDEWSWWRP